MTNDDRLAAVSMAMEPYRRNGKGGESVGGLMTKPHSSLHSKGYHVADVLVRKNGVIAWSADDGMFNNIHQYIAAEAFAPSGTVRARVLASDEYEGFCRTGVKHLRDWLEENFGVTLFSVPAREGSNKITHITINPDYVVSEEDGLTVRDLALERETRLMGGNVNAAYHKLGRMMGSDGARELLRSKVVETTQYDLPAPKRESIEDQS